MPRGVPKPSSKARLLVRKHHGNFLEARRECRGRIFGDVRNQAAYWESVLAEVEKAEAKYHALTKEITTKMYGDA